MSDLFSEFYKYRKYAKEATVLAPNEYISDDCNSIICRDCGEVRKVKKYSTFFGTDIWVKANENSYYFCSCDEKKAKEQRDKEDKDNFLSLYDCKELRELIGTKYLARTFDNTLKNANRGYNNAYDVCKAFCLDKEKAISDGKGIYLWSKCPGTGKSTLLACVRNDFIKDYKPCVMINSYDLINYASRNNTQENKKFNFSMFYSVPVLIVDDIGAQSLGRDSNFADWANSVWYSLMEKRNKNNLCTLFSSNYSPVCLKDRGYDFKTVDRIVERCSLGIYEIDGMSFRCK